MHIRHPINRLPQGVLRPFTMLFYIGVVLALSGGLLHMFCSVSQIWALVGAAMMLASCAVALKEWSCAVVKEGGIGTE